MVINKKEYQGIVPDAGRASGNAIVVDHHRKPVTGYHCKELPVASG